MSDRTNQLPDVSDNVISIAEWRAVRPGGASMRRAEARPPVNTEAEATPDASMAAPASAALSVEPTEEEQRIAVSRALDRLAARMPVQYDAILHVTRLWVRDELRADPAWVEGAMRLVHWLKANVEFLAFLKTHPGFTPEVERGQLEGFDAKTLATVDANVKKYADVPPAPRVDLVPSPHAGVRGVLRNVLGEKFIPVRADEWQQRDSASDPQEGGQTATETDQAGEVRRETHEPVRSVRVPLDARFYDDLFGREVFSDVRYREYRAHLDAIYAEHLSLEDGRRLEAELPSKRALLAPELLGLPSLEVQEYAVRAIGECYAQMKRVLDEADAKAAAGETPGITPLPNRPVSE